MPLLSQLPAKRPTAVFFDVDDTVAPSTRSISAEMAATLQALHDTGMHLGFVSGGSVEQIFGQVSQDLQRPHILLGTSGSHAVQVDAAGGRQELFKRGFSAAERAEILSALDALKREFGILSETTAEDQLQDRGCQFTLSALGRGADDRRKRAFDPDGSKRRAWVAFLTQRLGAGRFEIKVGGTTSVDLTARGVDKASGLVELLDRLGWKPEGALYFGDRFEPTGNDHPVLAILNCLEVHGPEQTLAYVQGLTRNV